MIPPFTKLFYVCVSMFFLTSLSHAENQKILCFSSDINNSFCKQEGINLIVLDKNADLAERIYQIQNSIRKEVDLKHKKLILLAKGFDGTLLSIAQGNMLTYYREHIKGLVLKNSEANYVHACKKLSSLDINKTCSLIKKFNVILGVKASHSELLKAISPSYQVDLYTPKSVIIDSNKRRIGHWEKLFKENSINYLLLKEQKLNIVKWFPFKESKKIQPKDVTVKPNYFGPLLRYHLWKMSYKSKHKIISKKEIAYDKDTLQTYDVFHKENSTNNPLLMYVHGGGWTAGDKINFNDFCQQYADKGFTTVSINYRLLNLPSVGMKEMVSDVKNAIEHVLNHASSYFIDLNRTVIMAESAGAQLAYMASTKLSKKHHIKVAVYNSITSDLRQHSKKKQIRLSGIKDDQKRELWLDAYSPLKNLMNYKVSTLGIHSLDDKVVPPVHLENLEVYSVVNYNNITSLWLKDGLHPISPNVKSLNPSYIEIENIVKKFIKSNRS